MTGRRFAETLARYGQEVTVYNEMAPEGVAVRAFFRPIRDRGTAQTVPSPLGQVKQDRFIYLGPAEVMLDDRSRVRVQDELYRVETSHPICVGGAVFHWWAVLTHRAKETVE